MSNYFGDRNGVAPPDTTIVSWLPFYHDMGLVLGIIAPILGGYRSELTSPLAFLQRPARWLHSLANGSPSWSAAPNFAFELAVRKTTDADIEGLDLGNVLGITSGAERVHPNTLSRFCNRFAPYNFREDMIRPRTVWRKRLFMWPAAIRVTSQKSSTSNLTSCPRAVRIDVNPRPAHRC